MGQQELCVSCGSSWYHNVTGSAGRSGCIDGVFWVGEMYHVTSLRLGFCHFTSSIWRQVNVSPVRGVAVTTTPLPENPLLPSHRRGTSLDRHMVYSGTASGRGERLCHFHKVWHFSNQRSDLFKGYINTFLKTKQGASGWPSDVGEDPELTSKPTSKRRGSVWTGARLKRILGCDPWPT